MDAAKLEALDGLVSEVDLEGPPTPEQQAEQQVVEASEQSARDWGMIVYTVGMGLSMIAPELRAVYTEDACMKWGTSMQPVAEKYGWNSPANVPELGLILATLPLAVPTVAILRMKSQERKAAEKRKPDQKAEEVAQGPGDGG